ncbi:MAG: hypothetical protein PHS65_06330 [Arcobacteraceae bacterium]|nr:hypothetical protein [Arcobacteraceae bacterium]
MQITSLELSTFLKKNNINQPTDFLANGNFKILNQLVTQKYGLTFSAFLSALFTKYQSLSLSKKFSGKKNFEFWYTEFDTKRDLGISYYMRKKCIKIGVELHLWSCEAKYDRNFPGVINKTDHFLIDWENVARFFKDINKVEDNLEAEEETQQAAKEEAVKELKKVKRNEIEVTNEELEFFAETMSNQPGIKRKESYKLTLLQKYFNNDKKTKQNLMLFLQGRKKRVKSTPTDHKYSELINRYFNYQNKPFCIQEIFDKDNVVLITAVNLDTSQRTVIKVPLEKFEEFKNCIYTEINTS